TWGGKKYIIEEKAGEQKLFRRGAAISVLKLMDGKLAAQYEDEIFDIKEKSESSNKKEEKERSDKKEFKKTYKPAPDQPWRKYKIHPTVSGKSSVSDVLN
ncbi:MAG: hypothetical protein LBS75_05010, partial [Synergistaceae bacterium]|nr:hypothetical protein [Synergistaceae bacterium]